MYTLYWGTVEQQILNTNYFYSENFPIYSNQFVYWHFQYLVSW